MKNIKKNENNDLANNYISPSSTNRFLLSFAKPGILRNITVGGKKYFEDVTHKICVCVCVFLCFLI